MEIAGLALGVLGVAGLFKSCIENFDIVVNARNFSDEFDLICTELAVQRIRLVLWGETLGLAPTASGEVAYNKAIDRPDIRPAVEKALMHLCSLLSKADIVTGRYELKDDADVQPASKGLTIFREKFDKFRLNIRMNQKQKSTWTVTRWAIHDLDKFRGLVDRVTRLIDGLESVTTPLGLLQQQQQLLVKEVESISDTQSLRLLHEVASSRRSARLISDAASARLSFVYAHSIGDSSSLAMRPSSASVTSRSFHTAPSRPAQSLTQSKGPSWRYSVQHGAHPDTIQEKPHARDGQEDIPQHQRIMSDLMTKRGKGKESSEPDFSAGDESYGNALAPVKQEDDRIWGKVSPKLLVSAHTNTSTARRVFLELRMIREANIPFLSASPVGDSLDKILASIEGPPGTPYEGGVFWISVKIPIFRAAPLLRFQTKIYHPNIDHRGKICANYEEWWTDPQLGRYIGISTTNKTNVKSWFSKTGSNHFSLGALLTALCDLLANPNIHDPLVPEVAEVYVTDFPRYLQVAKTYTDRYARGQRPCDGEVVFDEGSLDPGLQPSPRGAWESLGHMKSSTAASILSAPSRKGTNFDGLLNPAMWITHDMNLGESTVVLEETEIVDTSNSSFRKPGFPGPEPRRITGVVIRMDPPNTFWRHYGPQDQIHLVIEMDGSQVAIENSRWVPLMEKTDSAVRYSGIRLLRAGFRNTLVIGIKYDNTSSSLPVLLKILVYGSAKFEGQGASQSNTLLFEGPIITPGFQPPPCKLLARAEMRLKSLDVRFWSEPKPIPHHDPSAHISYPSFFRFTLTNLKVENSACEGLALNDFDVQEVIGSGICGPVYRAIKRETRRIYAVKAISEQQLRSDSLDGSELPKVEMSPTILDSPFFSRLKFAFRTGDFVYLASDYQPFRLFLSDIPEFPMGRVPYFKLLFYTAEMILALVRLQQHPAFLDIGPGNMLLDCAGHLVISDFGVSSVSDVAHITEYTAPETARANIRSSASYFWMLGCFVFHMAMGNPPFAGKDKERLSRNIQAGGVGAILNNTNIGPVLRSFIEELIVVETTQRPTDWDEIQRHPFLKRIDSGMWGDLATKSISPAAFHYILQDKAASEAKRVNAFYEDENFERPEASTESFSALPPLPSPREEESPPASSVVRPPPKDWPLRD